MRVVVRCGGDGVWYPKTTIPSREGENLSFHFGQISSSQLWKKVGTDQVLQGLKFVRQVGEHPLQKVPFSFQAESVGRVRCLWFRRREGGQRLQLRAPLLNLSLNVLIHELFASDRGPKVTCAVGLNLDAGICKDGFGLRFVLRLDNQYGLARVGVVPIVGSFRGKSVPPAFELSKFPDARSVIRIPDLTDLRLCFLGELDERNN